MKRTIDWYMEQASRYPILSREKEQILAKLAKNGDSQARQSLINSNLRFVIYVAKQHIGYVNNRGICFEDLVQQGNLGLIKAVDKFEPREIRLISFAVWWIKSMIRSYVMANFNIMKFGVTNPERALFFKAGKVLETLNIMDSEERQSARKEIADECKVDIDDVIKFEQRVSNFESSMDALRTTYLCSGGERAYTLHDVVHSDPMQFESAAKVELEQKISRIFSEVDFINKEEDIIRKRFLKDDPPTLEVIATSYNITRERVRQLEKRGSLKVHHHIATNHPELRDVIVN